MKYHEVSWIVMNCHEVFWDCLTFPDSCVYYSLHLGRFPRAMEEKVPQMAARLDDSEVWRFPEMGIPPVIIHLNGCFHEIDRRFRGTSTPMYGNPHMISSQVPAMPFKLSLFGATRARIQLSCRAMAPWGNPSSPGPRRHKLRSYWGPRKNIKINIKIASW